MRGTGGDIGGFFLGGERFDIRGEAYVEGEAV
jgi:hypothetical protein